MHESVPLVSIVLPTYNRAQLLPRAICSVLAQGFSDFELIIVDDCSQDDIHSLVESYHDSRIVYIRRKRNGGPAAARNSGVSNARGEFIAFQDSDDEWLQGKLELQVDALRAAPPNTALVFCRMVRYSSTHLSQYPARHLIPGTSDYHQMVKMNAIAFTQTWLVRRQALLEAGPFDERLKIWEDWDMLLRLTACHRVYCLPQVLLLSYATIGSVSSDIRARVESLQHIVAKYELAEPRDRRFIGRLYYLLGRFQYLNGEVAEARRSLRRALSYNRAGLKPAALLLLSALGERAARSFLK